MIIKCCTPYRQYIGHVTAVKCNVSQIRIVNFRYPRSFDTDKMCTTRFLGISIIGEQIKIPWYISWLGCTIILDLCLRSTFCDSVVLFTSLDTYSCWKNLSNRQSFQFIFKQLFIYIAYNLYPSFNGSNSPKLHYF